MESLLTSVLFAVCAVCVIDMAFLMGKHCATKHFIDLLDAENMNPIIDKITNDPSEKAKMIHLLTYILLKL